MCVFISHLLLLLLLLLFFIIFVAMYLGLFSVASAHFFFIHTFPLWALHLVNVNGFLFFQLVLYGNKLLVFFFYNAFHSIFSILRENYSTDDCGCVCVAFLFLLSLSLSFLRFLHHHRRRRCVHTNVGQTVVSQCHPFTFYIHSFGYYVYFSARL